MLRKKMKLTWIFRFFHSGQVLSYQLQSRFSSFMSQFLICTFWRLHTVWKNQKITLSEKNFVKLIKGMIYWFTSEKAVLTNLCQKMVTVKFCNFHAVVLSCVVVQRSKEILLLVEPNSMHGSFYISPKNLLTW